METVHNLSAGKPVTETSLATIARLPGRFHSVLNEPLKTLEGDPIFAMLELQAEGKEVDDTDLYKAFQAIRSDSDPKVCFVQWLKLSSPFRLIISFYQATAHLLHIIFNAKMKNTFYKLNVHAGM